jgi:hypothetical protein
MRQLCDRHGLTFRSSVFSVRTSEMPIPFDNNTSQARTHKATILREGGNALPCVEVKVFQPSSAAAFRPPHPVSVLTTIQSIRHHEGCPFGGDMCRQFSLTAIRCDLRLSRPQHTKGDKTRKLCLPPHFSSWELADCSFWHRSASWTRNQRQWAYHTVNWRNRPKWHKRAKWPEIRTAWMRWYGQCQEMEVPRRNAMLSWGRTMALCAALCLIGTYLSVEFDAPVSVPRIWSRFKHSHSVAFQRWQLTPSWSTPIPTTSRSTQK